MRVYTVIAYTQMLMCVAAGVAAGMYLHSGWAGVAVCCAVHAISPVVKA